MTAPPGRMALLVQAAWDPRLDTATRIRHLDIAMPKGYDQEHALAELRRSAEVRAQGGMYEANRIIEELLDATV